ncbi:MAG: hypothetical protein OHK93_005065 [Ramalina farinacea]|uniref:Uncharacterized protein n=1 Tax=Ramalina farinacea TaxID=258253 RepID=A0AA43U276_9LECA|nr:hypothetical protein [Ramalina farinacea]
MEFQGRRFYEIIKDEVTPPPPTLEEWDGQPSTPSDLSDDEDLIREWRWENRAPRFGGKPLAEDDDVAGEDEAEPKSEEEEEDDIDSDDGLDEDGVPVGEEDEAWGHVFESVETPPPASRATSPSPAKREPDKRDASHFSPQKNAAPPKKRKGTTRTKRPNNKADAELTSTILSLPPSLVAVREAVFSLYGGSRAIVWTPAEYEQYWSFLDNIWVHNKEAAMTKKGTQAIYYWCRLWQKT